MDGSRLSQRTPRRLFIGATALLSVALVTGSAVAFADGGRMAGHMQGDVDRHFIEMMIPHHDDAIQMADLALTQAEHQEIKGLATAIRESQSREIGQMRSWYQSWYGQSVPAVTMGMGHDDDTMNIDGARPFDKAFIEGMVPHHEMAVRMSSMALQGATRPETRNLLQNIITSQQAEIDQMRSWYRTWYGTDLPASQHGMGQQHGQGGMHGMQGQQPGQHRGPQGQPGMQGQPGSQGQPRGPQGQPGSQGQPQGPQGQPGMQGQPRGPMTPGDGSDNRGPQVAPQWPPSWPKLP